MRDGLPTHSDAGLRQALGHGLHAQGVPSRLPCLGDELATFVEGVEVGADDIGIEQWRQAARPQQHEHLAERVLRKDLGVALSRAGLVMLHFEPGGEARFVREHERFSGVGE